MIFKNGGSEKQAVTPRNTGKAVQLSLQFEVAIGEAVIDMYRVGNYLV